MSAGSVADGDLVEARQLVHVTYVFRWRLFLCCDLSDYVAELSADHQVVMAMEPLGPCPLRGAAPTCLRCAAQYPKDNSRW